MLMTYWSSSKVPTPEALNVPELSVVPVKPGVPETVGMQNSLANGHCEPGKFKRRTATGSSPVTPAGNPAGKNVAIRFASERLRGSTGRFVVKNVPAAAPDAAF